MAEPTREQDSRLNRLRLPAVLLLAFLLVVGAYYALHYRTNAEYLANRNFRLLATLATQVTEAVRNEGLVFGNVVGPSQEPSGTESLDLEKLIPRIKVSICAALAHPLPDQTTDKFKLWRTLDSSDGTYRLSFQSKREGEGEGGLSHCGEVKLQDLLDPLFSSREAFEAVLLANSAGKVVYLHGPKSLRVEQLNLLIQNRQDAKGEPGKDGKGGERGFNAFQGYSRSAEVQLGGRFYTAFVQPFRLSLASMETGTGGKPNDLPEVWLLAGLVAKDELAAKSLALSPSFVAFLLGVLLLAALAWPLAKLKLLGERQRVKKTDVLLVAVCSLLGVSVATLFVLDIGVYRILKSSSEMQLRDFADQMESNLLVEIRKAYDQLGELEKRARVGRLSSGDLQGGPYPDFESFALIDGQGQQVLRWAKGNSAPPISVAERLYFKRVHQGLTLNVPEPEKTKNPPFFLESVQSWTNGKWQAVIAKPVDPEIRQTTPPAQVAALAIRMLSVINPVMPSGFEFAVVGDDGTVLFHSDSARNLAENFFEETEHDRRFKSIVFARHDEPFNVRYWGESYRAVAIPVKGLPWTIVAMRNQQVLERVNLDWLVTTLIFVLLYTGAITLALIAIALLRPGYRAGWAWPDPKRRHDYVKLIAIFAIFCLAFLTALLGLRGTGHLFAVAGLLPMLSLVAAYLKLSPAGNRKAKQRAAEASGLLLLALLGLALYKAPMESGADSWAWQTVFALTTFACLLAADGPRRGRELEAGARMPISRSYPLLGLLLVLLGAVLPTAGFFKVAHRLQLNSFVRNGQLKMAKDLHDRVAPFKNGADPASLVSRLTVARGLIDENPATPGRGSEPSLDFYGWAFFNTTLSRPGLCEGKSEEIEFLAGVLPPYSQYTAENREMLHNHSSDDDWKWCELANGDMVFDSENYLEVSLTSRIEPMSRGNGPILAMAGLLPPQIIPEFKIDGRDPVPPSARTAGSLSLAQAPRIVLALFALTLFGIPLYALVIFVARRIFLLDVQEPLWAGRTGGLPDMVGANVLLINRTQKWQISDRKSFFPVSFRNLDEGENGWPARRLELVRDPNLTVLVEGFEHHIFDPAWNSRKLALLEELIFVHQRTVVVLSEISPAVLFSPVGLPADPAEDRWRTLLASFVQIDEDVCPPSARQGGAAGRQLSLRHWIQDFFHSRHHEVPSAPETSTLNSDLLLKECGSDLRLNRIGRELDSYATSANDEQILEELGECAQGYYGAIWASCSRDERVVLGHLAEEGLVNAKNRRIVRRLMARDLVQRAPNLCLMNETFRRFVVSPRCREQVLNLEQAAGRSAWDRFHWPFSVALAACAALILVTQQELLDSTVATITGVTAGLPTLLKLLDTMGWKRGAKGA